MTTGEIIFLAILTPLIIFMWFLVIILIVAAYKDFKSMR